MGNDRTYYDMYGVSLRYDCGRDLFWLGIRNRQFPFDARGFDDFYGRTGDFLIRPLSAVHPDLKMVLEAGDIEQIALALEAVKAQDDADFAEFKKANKL